MKHLHSIVFLPSGTESRYQTLHSIWIALCLTGLGAGIGLLTLLLGAASYSKLPYDALFQSYLEHPLLLKLNLLFPILLIWFFYFLTRRSWAAYLGSALPCLILALVNYFKIQLRGDSLLGADLLLFNEAGGILGNYTLDIDWPIWLAVGYFLLGLMIAVFLLPHGTLEKSARICGVFGSILLLVCSYFGLYLNSDIYEKTANTELINPWSDIEVYVSKGFLYPFLYSTWDIFPTPPEGYHKSTAQAVLEEYSDSDIPDEQKVNVVGIMLEAFCDLTDFPALSGQSDVQEVYRPWHQLEENSVSGNLLTNIFAGGTVDSEWGFLTGYSQYDQFRSPTDSYVWYLREQGYDTLYHHPGYSWFYNRQNVNEYLGFQESMFTENCFGSLVDPSHAVFRSDKELVDYLLEELTQERKNPLFSFSVTYQNHGPYSAGSGQPILTPDATGWSQESCDILSSYLRGISDTISNLTRFVNTLEESSQPTVVVLFGDHKPWLGNGESVYTELAIDFDFSTLEGFSNYYATPYLIWANSAAREVLDTEFVGDGGDFSPCFLMPKLFDLCGWEGSGFMQLAREMRDITPMLHSLGLFVADEQLTDHLSDADTEFYKTYLCAQYWRETEKTPVF